MPVFSHGGYKNEPTTRCRVRHIPHSSKPDSGDCFTTPMAKAKRIENAIKLRYFQKKYNDCPALLREEKKITFRVSQSPFQVSIGLKSELFFLRTVNSFCLRKRQSVSGDTRHMKREILFFSCTFFPDSIELFR